MEKKNMILAMVLSVIWSGLGLIYAEDMKNGVILLVLAIIFELIYLFVNQIGGLLVFVVWVYSLYTTYNHVKAINGG